MCYHWKPIYTLSQAILPTQGSRQDSNSSPLLLLDNLPILCWLTQCIRLLLFFPIFKINKHTHCFWLHCLCQLLPHPFVLFCSKMVQKSYVSYTLFCILLLPFYLKTTWYHSTETSLGRTTMTSVSLKPMTAGYLSNLTVTVMTHVYKIFHLKFKIHFLYRTSKISKSVFLLCL